MRIGSLCLLVLVLGGFSSAASARVLSNVLVSRQNNVLQAEVILTCPHRLQATSTDEKTTRLELSLRADPSCSPEYRQGGLREMLAPSGGRLAGIRQVELNGQADDTRLIVRFAAPTRVAVSQAADLQRLTLTVLEQEVTDEPAAVTDPVIGPAPLSATVAAADNYPRQSMRVHTGPEDDLREGAFVVALFTSTDYAEVSAMAAGLNRQALREQLSGAQRVYIAELQPGQTTWFSLRLGFFSSEGRAEAALYQLLDAFPEAFVARVPASEYQVAENNPVTPEPATAWNVVSSSSPAKPAAGLTSAELGRLMNEGRSAVLAGDYHAAAGVYNTVLNEGDSAYARDALEYAGIAYEKSGQNDNAVAAYRRYLDQYPDDAGAARVQQRLNSLLLQQPRAMLADTAVVVRDDRRWESYGGLGQYYRLDSVSYSGRGSEVIQSAVLTDGDYIARRRGRRFEFESRLSFGNVYSLLSDADGDNSQTRFYYLYGDLFDKDSGLGLRLGRQRLRASGILSRFDGAHLSWQFANDWRINFMAGEPVYSTRSSDGVDRRFVGASLDVFAVGGATDISVFFNAQEVDGVSDREAVGGQVRYYGESLSLVSTLDYDVGYSTLNNLAFLGNWQLGERTVLNGSFDYRRSPYLLSENALIGEGISSIEELRLLYTDDEIRELAEQKSGETTTATVGVSRPLYERFQLNADVSLYNYRYGDLSGSGQEQPDDPGNEWLYSLSFTGSSLLTEGDSSTVTMRYRDGAFYSTTSLLLDSRFPLSDKFRFNPRLLLTHRDQSAADVSEVTAVPALRLFYQAKRNLRLEFEAGGRWSDTSAAAGSTSATSWFIYTGYRTGF